MAKTLKSEPNLYPTTTTCSDDLLRSELGYHVMTRYSARIRRSRGAMIDHMNAIVLAVRDVEKCALFYRDKLGFDLKQLDPGEAYLRIGSGDGIVLALKSIDLVASEISEKRIRPGEESIERTHCVVFVKDVDAEFNELSRREVHFIHPPKLLGDRFRTAHFEDPEGHIWEIAQFMDG